ncbi:hypothetical protein LguiB_026544 [Lonicera macranthoides]
MALPPTLEYREVAAAISQPASTEDICTLQNLIGGLTLYNTQGPSIQYRHPIDNQDIVEAVYRWDDRSYTEIFRTGFHPRDPGSTTWEDYYNLERHVNGGGAPGDTSPIDGSVFVSTTRLTNWKPRSLMLTQVVMWGITLIVPSTSINQVEAFIFTIDQCLQINYAPRTTKDFIIKGPMSIGDFFPSLKNSIFATGIDAAFTSSVENEVYIFRSNMYILLNFVSGDIIGGPKKITNGFPSLKKTIFKNAIDAAFASSRDDEAYIFKGDQYALINFASGTTDDYLLHPEKKISLGFPSLEHTVFKDGLDAAFTAKAKNEAYIFKGNYYALINYAPGTTDDHIIHTVSPVSDGFHSLKGIIPRYPCSC